MTNLLQRAKETVNVLASSSGEILASTTQVASTIGETAAAISETGAQSLKDMGKTMAALKGRYAGQMDFAKASALVKQTLA